MQRLFVFLLVVVNQKTIKKGKFIKGKNAFGTLFACPEGQCKTGFTVISLPDHTTGHPFPPACLPSVLLFHLLSSHALLVARFIDLAHQGAIMARLQTSLPALPYPTIPAGPSFPSVWSVIRYSRHPPDIRPILY